MILHDKMQNVYFPLLAPAEEYTTWDKFSWATVGCRRAICSCDSVAAKCFGKNVFNHSLASYDKSRCEIDTHVLA
jgi:hypothetical protein